MKRLLYQLSIGLLFALPVALLSFAFASPQTTPRVEAAPAAEPGACVDCHSQFQTAWAGGAHSQAISDPVFKSAWDAQGNPNDCLNCHTTGYDPATGTYHSTGVTCEACHQASNLNHPLEPAFMSRSADLCGNCHKETFFEWQASKHGQSDLTCVSCHDPHSTSLRAQDASTLCASCHGTRVAAFAHSNHSAEGLTCTDCHIDGVKDAVGMGRGKRTHTFAVDLDTCNQCHENEIHNPTAAMLVSGDTPLPTPMPPDSMASGDRAAVATEPQPVSPLGFAIVAGLIGLAFGILLAPWLERGFQRVRRAEPAKKVM